MTFLDLAKQRFSVRSYSNKKVEKEKLDCILAAARAAPTGANRQPHRLIVVQEQSGLEKICTAARIYNAPVVIIVCAEKNAAWTRPYDGKNIADIDTAIVTDHMMLEATDLGLGSVWICYFKPVVVKEAFNIPENWDPVHLLAIGYANEPKKSPDRHETLRKPLADFVYFETVSRQ